MGDGEGLKKHMHLSGRSPCVWLDGWLQQQGQFVGVCLTGAGSQSGTRQAGSWTPPAPSLSESSSRCMGCGAGRGDRCEISRCQKRLTGADSLCGGKSARSRRAPICGFQDPWAFRCRGHRGNQACFFGGTWELGAADPCHTRKEMKKRGKKENECPCSEFSAVQCSGLRLDIHRALNIQDAKGVE